MHENRNDQNRDTGQKADVSQRTGSTEHNDYRINAEPLVGSDKHGREEGKKKDTDESYMDYNGNSKANDPNRSK